MKKLLCIVLALMMFVTVFAGCGTTAEPDASAAVSDDANTNTDDPNTTDDANTDEDKEFALGEVTDTAYTNSFAELSFALPEGWLFASNVELEEMMGAGSDVIFGDDKQAALEYAKQSTVYDMMVQNPDDGANIIVMFENTAMYVGGTSLTEEDYLAALAENLGTVDTVGYTVDTTTSKATMNGKEYTVLESSIEEYGAFQTYYVRRIGKYMLCICFTGYEANPGSTMQAYFEQ